MDVILIDAWRVDPSLSAVPYEVVQSSRREPAMQSLEFADSHAHGNYRMENQIGFLLRVAMQRHTAIFTALMVHNLTQTQFAVLVKLYDIGPCSQIQLAREVCLDANTMKGVIDRLKSRKLVKVMDDPADGRRTITSLTTLGVKIYQEAVCVGDEITKKTLAPLSPAEQATLLKIIKKIA